MSRAADPDTDGDVGALEFTPDDPTEYRYVCRYCAIAVYQDEPRRCPALTEGYCEPSRGDSA